MLELGQPNHPYDLATLGGGGFRIRAAARRGDADDARRRRARAHADDLLICDADDRPIGLAGIMGGADTEISDATTDGRRWRWRGSRPSGSPARSPASGCARRRRPASSGASIRTASTPPSPASSSCSARRALSSSSTPAPSTRSGRVAARRASAPARCASAEVNRILGTALDRRRPPAAARPDRVHRHRRRRPGHRRDPVVAARQRRGDRRHRGGRPACTATTASASALPASPRHGQLIARQQRRRRLRQVLLGLGITEVDAEPVPRAGHARPRRPRRRRPADHQPAGRRGERAADVAAARSARRGRVQRVAPPARRGAVRDRPRLPARGRASCPTSTRRSASCSPDEEAPAAVAVWREIAAAMGVGARIDQTARAAGPAPDPIGDAASPGATRSAPSARWPRTCSTAFGITGRRRRRSSSTCARCSDSEPQPAQWRPTSRLPVERPRPRLRPCPTTCRPRRLEQGDPPGRRPAARRPRAVRRLPRCLDRRRAAQPGLPAPAAGAGPQPDRRRRRRRPPAGHHGDRQARRRAPRLTPIWAGIVSTGHLGGNFTRQVERIPPRSPAGRNPAQIGDRTGL